MEAQKEEAIAAGATFSEDDDGNEADAAADDEDVGDSAKTDEDEVQKTTDADGAQKSTAGVESAIVSQAQEGGGDYEQVVSAGYGFGWYYTNLNPIADSP